MANKQPRKKKRQKRDKSIQEKKSRRIIGGKQEDEKGMKTSWKYDKCQGSKEGSKIRMEGSKRQQRRQELKRMD